MRIVQAAGWYFPDSLGGTEVYVDALAQRLRLAGHDVIVAAPDSGAAAPRDYLHNDIPVYRYPTARAITRDQARGVARVPGGELFHQWLQIARPDIVHFHTFVPGLSLPEVMAARATGARVFVTSHAASVGFLCERGTLMRDGAHVCDARVSTTTCATCALLARGVPRALAAPLAAAPLALAEAALRLPQRLGTAAGMRALIARHREAQRALFEAIEAFVVLTDWAARALLAAGAPPAKVQINRLGIASTPAAPLARVRHGGRVIFGFVGRAESIKGLDTAVRAVTLLPRDRDVRLHAVAVANGPAERATLEQCRALARGDARVTFHDAVAPADVSARLATFDVLLCPSRVVEGGPTVALEARAVGTPVIGSRVPALTEIVRDGYDGLLHAPGDAHALADCLGRVAGDPCNTVDLWRTRLPAARTADDIAADYLALYRAA